MKPPENFTSIVDHVEYSTKTATLIAHDAYLPGGSSERSGKNTFLYRTPHGAYFVVDVTIWPNEKDALTPVNSAEAIRLYRESLTEHIVDFKQAFPGEPIQNA